MSGLPYGTFPEATFSIRDILHGHVARGINKQYVARGTQAKPRGPARPCKATKDNVRRDVLPVIAREPGHTGTGGLSGSPWGDW